MKERSNGERIFEHNYDSRMYFMINSIYILLYILILNAIKKKKFYEVASSKVRLFGPSFDRNKKRE